MQQQSQHQNIAQKPYLSDSALFLAKLIALLQLMQTFYFRKTSHKFYLKQLLVAHVRLSPISTFATALTPKITKRARCSTSAHDRSRVNQETARMRTAKRTETTAGNLYNLPHRIIQG